MYDALIIGGGITGLSAAYQLQKKSQNFRILEPNCFGGLMRTSKVNGFTLEHGPNVLLGKDELLLLIKELGLEDAMVAPFHQPYKQYVWYNGTIQSLPKSLGVFFKTPLLTIYDKLAIPFRVLLPGMCKPKNVDESVYQMFSRVLGARGVRALLEPALRGIYGGDPQQLSARALFPDLWNHLMQGKNILSFVRGRKGKRMFVLRQGMSTLVQALVEKLELAECSPGDAVKRLFYGESGRYFEVVTHQGEVIEAKSVYVTTSGCATATYLEEFLPMIAKRLRLVRSAPIIVLHYGAARNLTMPDRAFGVLFPRDFQSKMLGVMFNSNLFSHVAPQDQHLLTVCFGGVDAEQVLKKSDQELFRDGQVELARKIGATNLTPLAIQRWREAIPQYEVGHFELGEAISAAQRSYPGLFFVGADMGGVGVPDRIRMAFEAVRHGTEFIEREIVQNQMAAGEEKHAMFRM